MITFLVLYLIPAALLVVPVRRIAYRDFGWFGGYSGGLVGGLLWPLMLRNAILAHLATRF